MGSSSYITDREGRITQHTEYIAFGEVLFEEHSTSRTMPYLFNGKELDSETGLYYYGARYYDPKVSIFLNVDPLAEKTMTPYAYTNNNPIMLVDPTGKEAENCCPAPPVPVPIPLLPPPPIVNNSPQKTNISLDDLREGVNQVKDFYITFYTIKYYEVSKSIKEGFDAIKSLGERVLNNDNNSNQNANKKGGGKNSPHANQRAKQSAGEKYNEKKQEYENLNSKPNKTKEDKSQLKKLEGQLKQLRNKKDFKGENHSRNAKGNR